MQSHERAVMRVLAGEKLERPPIWMMRQAGRYLPEYRAIRAQAPNFLDFCYNTDLATEVTLQPIRRYGFDAAILFSDIFVVPDALGYPVKFEEGRGPVLEPLSIELVDKLDQARTMEHLAPVIATIKRLRAELPTETTLLGFCGAPWTVACYSVAGHTTQDQVAARIGSYRDPALLTAFIDHLVEASISYLVAQLDGGADALQIFDTWAGVLDDIGFEQWSVGPTRKIVDGVKAQRPNAKIIGFPKASAARLKRYVEGTGVDAVGLDWTVPAEVAQEIQKIVPVQGNMDPMRLVAGGRALETGIDHSLEVLGNGPHIFNLGHGVVPQTPPEHVAEMVKRVKGL
ncbi:uroporphyrinogen decarboxylase [Pseudovibrio sp. Tun.PSC04-5.I4]|uniref:uroporphyrinogen decarboxylase n=1 Tax=Pseudovibrio sp. Tun.PSC04-5.I4 TaxID=1798213 RepID=UPI00087DFE53|nr:uroporphyrinogen decarboxylase [Pseudovibrio sp. Tun.PSC04-5.I4]SDR26519.1 uroporphyrinogen decarboxylase [Pseudovibrio sp. Tun.PSC04-5.I4]